MSCTNLLILFYVAQKVVIDWQIDMIARIAEVNADQSGQGSVTFKWIGSHNVWQFDDKQAFESCDFNKAKQLTTRSGYLFSANVGTYYFGCSVYGHCAINQKLQLIIKGEGAFKGLAYTRIVWFHCNHTFLQCYVIFTKSIAI